VRLWSIRQAEEFAGLKNGDALRTQSSKVDQDFRAAYDWMSQQLNAHAGPPPKGVDCPIWLWQHCYGTSKSRPDLRTRCLLPTGTAGVRIEVDLPSENVLLSNFDAWHCVLNNHPYFASDAECEEMERSSGEKDLSHADLEKVKVDSWQRIFDLSLIPDPRVWSVQGVVWEIPVSSITKVEYFTAR
jgi:hypothetical protein